MFWRHNASSTFQIEGILAKEDVALQEVMDCEDIINECGCQNKNLIDFLLRPEVIEELVTLTVKEPSIELSEKTRFRYPNIACELLTCDVPAINERIAGDERLLAKLYEFLESEPPLNPLLASYFSKIMGGLIAQKTEQNWLSYQLTCLQVLDFLKARETFLALLLKHLGTSAIMDLMLKLMTQVMGVEIRQNILNWLDSQGIVQQLVCLMDPKIERLRHDNVAQLLCDFIRTSRDTVWDVTERVDPNPLLNTLESPDTIRLLLDQMFNNGKCESSIVGGIAILLALLDVNQSSTPTFRNAAVVNNMYKTNMDDEPVNTEQKQIVVRTVTEVINTRLKDFHNLLIEPPKQPLILTTVGPIDPPLGNTRLQVARLLAALVQGLDAELHKCLIALGTFNVLLDLFFQYQWNNFLHTQVVNAFIAVLDAGRDSEEELTPLSRHLMDNCNLIDRILKAWKDNDQQQLEKNAVRRGYMGHLIHLVNNIVRVTSNTPFGNHLAKLKPEAVATLNEFKTTTLAEVIEQQDKLLGGLHPSSLNHGYGDIPYNSGLQQDFARYQMQNTLPNQFTEGYSGFNDDAFNDGDNILQEIESLSNIGFAVSDNEMMQRDEFFKQVCAQNINTLGLGEGDDQVFEERDHTFQTVIEKKDAGNDKENSSDSDDGSPSGGEDNNIDEDPWSAPKGDPWSVVPDSGWADFSSAAFAEPQLVFSTSFPFYSKTTETDKIEPKPEEASKMTEEKVKAGGGSGEDNAAAGDHSAATQTNEKEKQRGSESIESQSSISLEGDTCKASTKTVEKLQEKPSTEEPGKA